MTHADQVILLLAVGVVICFVLFKLLQDRGEETEEGGVHKTKSRVKFSFKLNREPGDNAGFPSFTTRTTRVALSVKIARPPGVATGFPTLRASNQSPTACTLERVEVKATRNDGKEASAQADVSPGTLIPPEPGLEVNLTEAFRKVATELCGWSGQKVQVKYQVITLCALGQMTIPIEEPPQNAYLSSEGLQDIAVQSKVES